MSCCKQTNSTPQPCCAPVSAPTSACCAPAPASTPVSACCAPASASKAACCAPAPAASACCAPAPVASACCAPASKSACCAPVSASACCAPSSGRTPTACCADLSACDSTALKDRVREDYAKVATVTAVNADAVATQFGYTQEELAAIPDGANLGVSCGNPLALANVKPGEVVVDLGSGAGLDAFLASNKVGPSGKVYGIDMTPEMLAKAKDNAAKRNITNVEFLKGEIEALPLPDAVADLVISNCVINLVPNKQKAFSEIYRILKPGGRLAISDIVLKKDFPDEVKANVGMFSACFTGAMFLSAVPDMLKSAGFQGIVVNDAHVDLNAYKALGSGGSGCCGSLPPATHPLIAGLADIDFNDYAASAKIFALK